MIWGWIIGMFSRLVWNCSSRLLVVVLLFMCNLVMGEIVFLIIVLSRVVFWKVIDFSVVWVMWVIVLFWFKLMMVFLVFGF